MAQRCQISLRFVQVPADAAAAVIEHKAKVGSARFSCDAAYYIPTLLKDGPPGFNATTSNGWGTVVPYPTFNECLKDNVPLFFFRRSSHDKQENVRAKQLLELFADRLSKRLTTFHGDVLIFWRRNVDEIRHQMKLTDFTLADMSRLVGSPGVLGTAAAVPTSPTGCSEDADEKPLSSPTVSSCHAESNTSGPPSSSTSRPPVPLETAGGGGRERGGGKGVDPAAAAINDQCHETSSGQQHPSDAPRGITSSPQDVVISSKATTTPAPITTTQQQRLDPLPLPLPHQDSSCCPPQFMRPPPPATLSAEDTKVPDTSTMSSQEGIMTTANLLSGHQKWAALRTFLETVHAQLPLYITAFDEMEQILHSGAGGGHTTESQASARKLSAEVSRLTTINAQLVGENELCRQELLAAQSQARLYLEETTRLTAEVALLREETAQLRKATALLEEELLLSGGPRGVRPPLIHQTTAASDAATQQAVRAAAAAAASAVSMKNPAGTLIDPFTPLAPPSPTCSKRPLFHVKGGNDKGPLLGATSGFGTTNLLRTNSGNRDTSAADHFLLSGLSSSSASSNGCRLRPRDVQPLGAMRRCIVTQVYKPTSSGQSGTTGGDQFAQLLEGEAVTVEREDPTGWWWVTNGTPAGSGWYPFSFLQPANSPSPSPGPTAAALSPPS